MSRRIKAVNYLATLPKFQGVGRETLTRFVSVVALFYGIPPETRSF